MAYDVDVEVVHDALADERRRIADVSRPDGFSLEVRGGESTALRFGRPFDYLKAKATSEVAIRFCERFALPLSASFKYSLYGDDNVAILAVGWADRMRALLQVWRNHGFNLGFRFDVADLAWEPPRAFNELFSEAGHAPSRRRALQINQLRPR